MEQQPKKSRQTPLSNVECVICKREFPGRPNRKYCSKACKQAHINESLHRPPVKLNCVICKKEFLGRATRKYCSWACKYSRMRVNQRKYDLKPESIEHKRKYMREYIMRRYRTDPDFKRRMTEAARRWQRKRRAALKEACKNQGGEMRADN